MTKGDAVIIVSNTLKKFIIKNYDIDKSKIFVIHRGVPDLNKKINSSFTSWKDNWKKTNKNLKNKKILTLPVRISRHKGIEDFIHLISKLNEKKLNVHGLIVGEAKSQNYLQQLVKSIKSQALTENISLLGYRSDIYEIIKISKITFSLSSLPEAFGRTVIESIKLGVPVIGYNHGGVGEQLKHIFSLGLISLNNKNLLFKKTFEFIQKPPKVEPTALFTLKKMQENTLMVYKKIARK